MERPQEKPQEKKLANVKQNVAKHEEKKETKQEVKQEKKEDFSHQEHNHEHHEHKHETPATEEKKETKPVVKLTKKHEAVVNALSLPISKKHSMYIGSFIKNKPIDLAIKQLEEVIKFKRAIPYKGEIPHRSDPGMMSGRYPINASKVFIQLLKGLKGNAIVNQMDIDKVRITWCSAFWASRPMKRGGAKFKRCNVTLKAKEVTKVNKEAKK
ncbi:MAG: hypothetical protein AABX11_06405 [Nanoarchaeota archaeon]